MAKSRPAAPSDTSPATQTDDPIQALISSAEKVMEFAGELPFQQFPLAERLKVAKRLAPVQAKARNALYGNAGAALISMQQTGVGYTEAESRIKRVVGICNGFLKWGRRNLGKGPPMPDGSKEPDEQEDLEWTDRQTRLVQERLAFFAAQRDACADLLRLWQTVRNGETKRKPPAGENADAGIDWNELILSPPLTAAQIAESVRQPVDLVGRTLHYFRQQHDFGFIKDNDAGFGEAAFRYKMVDVLPHLKKWYDKRQKKAAHADA